MPCFIQGNHCLESLVSLSQEEIYNNRDLSYSAWHRRGSTRRFIGLESAQLLAMIDVDVCLYLEYDDYSREPLALVEVAIDTNQSIKVSTVTKNLARRCKPLLPAFTCLYTLGCENNPADSNYKDITDFRTKRIWPEPETNWKHYYPREWAEFLLKIRQKSSSIIDQFQGYEIRQLNFTNRE